MGKADAGTKKFWRDNERFADLFNADIINGVSVIHAGIKNRKSLHPRQVFWALPRIYQGKIEELKGVMVRKEAAELIGTVTGSKTLINMAKRRKKGEEMELCNS